MIDSRKKLMTQISMLEKQLNQQEKKLADNKQYLATTINGPMLPFFIFIIPAFLWGWKSGREKWLGKIVKHATEVGRMVASAYLKKQLFKNLSFYM